MAKYNKHGVSTNGYGMVVVIGPDEALEASSTNSLERSQLGIGKRDISNKDCRPRGPLQPGVSSNSTAARKPRISPRFQALDENISNKCQCLETPGQSAPGGAQEGGINGATQTESALDRKVRFPVIRTRARKNLNININTVVKNLTAGMCVDLSDSNESAISTHSGNSVPRVVPPSDEKRIVKSSQGEGFPLITLSDEELEARQVERRKSETRKAKVRAALRCRKAEKPSEYPSYFETKTKESTDKLMSVLTGEKGVDARTTVLRRMRAEIFRIYRQERLKATGFDYFVRPSEQTLKAADNIAEACVAYNLQPNRLITYWLDPDNNFTNMKFPTLQFVGAPGNVDRVVTTLIPVKTAVPSKTSKPRSKRAVIIGHSYCVDDIHPELRSTLLAAGHDLTKWDNRALMTIQNCAINYYYDCPVERLDPDIQPLVRTALPLFSDRAGGR